MYKYCMFYFIFFVNLVYAGIEDEVHLTFLHLNDVYEITPVSGGTQGGIARVASIKKQLLIENPNTYITLSGDIYGPSGLSNVALVDNKLLAGKHVVAVLNKVGVDYFTFGDHEFDQFSADQVLSRIRESTFPIISSNYADKNGDPFQQSDISGNLIDIPKNTIFNATNAKGDSIRVGIFGVTEPLRSSDLEIMVTDHTLATAVQVAELKEGNNPVDVLVAMTHLSINIDKTIAASFPKIDLILGGDDHNIQKVSTENGAPIYKSDSNARNVYIVDLYYDTANDTIRIEDRIQPISDAIPDDPEVLAEVDKWLQIGFDAFRNQGFQPEREIGIAPFDLDGFATSVRSQSTALTDLITNGVKNTAKADFGLLLSGLLRLDDLIPKGGTFIEYDVIRSYPNDNEIVTANILGSELIKLLDSGLASQGSGQFLITSANISNTEEKWFLNSRLIQATQRYSIGLEKILAQFYESKDILAPFENGDFLAPTGMTTRQVLTSQIAKISLQNQPGDANGDGIISDQDIESILLIIFNELLTIGADCNQDGVINVLDHICVINALFNYSLFH